MKIRFIEPGNLPYRKSLKNLFIYDGDIITPSNGLLTLANIVKIILRIHMNVRKKLKKELPFLKRISSGKY